MFPHMELQPLAKDQDSHRKKTLPSCPHPQSFHRILFKPWPADQAQLVAWLLNDFPTVKQHWGCWDVKVFAIPIPNLTAVNISYR